MPRQNAPLLAFNRGVVDPLALARVDLDRITWSAETQTNWIPRSLGAMMLRPGWKYLGSTHNDAVSHSIPFVFNADTKAKIEFTANIMRVWVDDAVVTRTAITGTFTNGTFDTDLTGWTDADETGGTSAWKTGGYLSLIGDGSDLAIRRQTFTVTDTSTAHPIRIIIERGPVLFKLGSTSGGSEYLGASLSTGEHSIEVTPTGDLYVEFSSAEEYEVLVDSIAMESTGVMTLPTDYSASDIGNIRYDQSADVIYLACKDKKQKKIERRSQSSWSFVDFDTEDGPFGLINVSPVKLTPSGLTGDITVSSNKAFFKSTNVGALFQIDSTGQDVEASISAENNFTGDIKVTGTGSGRAFSIFLSGLSGTGTTVTLQRSVNEPGTWADVTTYTTDQSVSYNDALANQTMYYRIGVKTGDYVAGTIEASLSYGAGSITGVFKVVTFTDDQNVSAIVVKDLGSTDETGDWYEGEWSDRRGHPTTVSLFEGRLWWAGKSKLWGSVSDAYGSYDVNVEGDTKAIRRQIGFGPVDDIHWLLPLQRMLMGTASAEISVRSSSLDEAITSTTINLKHASTNGSSFVDAEVIDNRGIYAGRSETRLYELSMAEQVYGYYASTDLTALNPNLLNAGIKRIAVQRQPDTRVHVVLDDGTAALFVTDPAEQLKAWVPITTDGDIEDVCILPGTEEDNVYYTVNRTNGRYVEKWALESECKGRVVGGFAQSKCLDSFVETTGQTITGAGHLEGETVGVWADGADRGTFTVASGQFDLGASYTNVLYGQTYEADFKSSKLAYAAGMGTALNQRKRITGVGLILADTHAQGIEYGTDADHLDGLPLYEEGKEVDSGYIWSSYDFDALEFNGEWKTDTRLFLRATAPRPCTVLAAVLQMVTHDKS